MYAKVSNLSLIGELDNSLKESESGLPSLIPFLFFLKKRKGHPAPLTHRQLCYNLKQLSNRS